MSRSFPNKELKTQEIKRLVDIQRVELKQKISEGIREVEGWIEGCVKVPEQIQNFSCRPFADSSMRSTYSEPKGYDCVAVNVQNPEWVTDYRLCESARQNRIDRLGYYRAVLQRLDGYEAQILTQIGEMTEADFTRVRSENLKKAGLAP